MKSSFNYPRKKRQYANHIGITHPQLAHEFHPTLNEHLSVQHLTAGSNRRIWWLGPCGHHWQTTTFLRTNGKGHCPTCRIRPIDFEKTLAFLYPHLLTEWHSERNHPSTPQNVLAGSGKKVWWKCQTCDHEWAAKVYSRTYSFSGCPNCARKHHRQVMKNYQLKEYECSIEVTHPELRELWATTENLPLTMSHITQHSQRLVFWHCKSCRNLFKEKTTFLTKGRRRHHCPSCRGD